MKHLVCVDRLDHYGRGIGKVDNKIIFINQALPGEEVYAEITEEHKNYLEGKIVEFKKVSSNRVEPLCPYYKECGGCQLLHMTYEEQLKFKTDKVKNIFNKYLKEDVIINDIIATKQFNYRNKITLKVKDQELGYFKEKTNAFVKIDNCLIASQLINDRIGKVNIKQAGDEVSIRCSDNTKEVMMCYSDNGFILDKLGDLTAKISSHSFYQVNNDGMLKLYEKVKDYCNLTGNEKILDLYCGTGSIGLFLARNAKQVLGIEVNKDAIVDANYNKKTNGIKNISFMCEDVKNVDIGKFDIIIVDPPRIGLDKKVVLKLLKKLPSRIIYVSCDPLTLVRDLNILKEHYNIKEVTPVDMFPNTYHVETVTFLELKR